MCLPLGMFAVHNVYTGISNASKFDKFSLKTFVCSVPSVQCSDNSPCATEWTCEFMNKESCQLVKLVLLV